MTVAPPPGLTLFRTSFGEPGVTRIVGHSLDLVCDVATEGLSPAAVLRLAAEDRLQLVFDVRAATSSMPVVHTGCAALGADGGRLTGRLSFPLAAFGGASCRLLYLVFAYQDFGRFEEWGYPGSWIAASLPRADVFEAYFTGFNLERQ